MAWPGGLPDVLGGAPSASVSDAGAVQERDGQQGADLRPSADHARPAEAHVPSSEGVAAAMARAVPEGLLGANASVRAALLAWYDAHRRELPWRAQPGTRPDPYAVFVSEVMLQQTRVETVLRHFGPWIARFPDWSALAAASEQEVLAQWAGLGYYRRARNLHAVARHVAEHGLPRDAAGLRVLPGVGPYMAAAVASIAFGQPVAAVDGNVVRVVSRLADIEDRVDRATGRRRVEALAHGLLDPARPGDWNQALMDLGAMVCTPRPHCDACPVARHCAARSAGSQAQRPVLGAKAAPRHEAMHFALVRKDGRVLVVPRPDDGLLAGTWMLPGGPSQTPLETLVRQQTGLEVALGPAGTARHAFTHRTWDMRVHAAEVLDDGTPRARAAGARTGSGSDGGPTVTGRPDIDAAEAPGMEARWVDPDAPDIALSTCCRKAIGAAATLRAVRPSPFV